MRRDHPGAVTASRFRGGIVYEGVSLEYKRGTPVLPDIDLRIEPGEGVAISGRTGAGSHATMARPEDGQAIREAGCDGLGRSRRLNGPPPPRCHIAASNR